MSKVPRWLPSKKSEEPNSGTYTSAFQPISRSFRLAKSKNLNFIDELLKRKKNVPGPIYDIAKADRVLSNGTGKSYK